jgi:hypothetical protein
MAEPSPDGATTAPGDPLVISESEAFALLAHLVTSAELCMVEPYDYGILSMLPADSPRTWHHERAQPAVPGSKPSGKT